MAGDEDKEVEPRPETEERVDGDEPDTKGEEEDTGAQTAPIVKLEEISVSTGEENEDVLFEIKAKLYRYDKDGSQWKERGVGQVKLLEHKSTKKIRLLMRQQRTLKICANHTVLPDTVLQEHAGSDKSLVWHASDFADGELKEEMFTMRFGSIESLQRFRAAFKDAQAKVQAISGAPSEDGVDEVAKALESIKLPAEGTEKASETEEEGKEEPKGGKKDEPLKEEPKAAE